MVCKCILIDKWFFLTVHQNPLLISTIFHALVQTSIGHLNAPQLDSVVSFHRPYHMPNTKRQTAETVDAHRAIY